MLFIIFDFAPCVCIFLPGFIGKAGGRYVSAADRDVNASLPGKCLSMNWSRSEILCSLRRSSERSTAPRDLKGTKQCFYLRGYIYQTIVVAAFLPTKPCRPAGAFHEAGAGGEAGGREQNQL